MLANGLCYSVLQSHKVNPMTNLQLYLASHEALYNSLEALFVPCAMAPYWDTAMHGSSSFSLNGT
jgi:hypothetical protein